jgi:predicted dehydrogenase
MSELRMGVVGVGALGRHHARILSEMDGVQLVAVADVRRQIVEPIAAQYGCTALRDYSEMLDRVDAAVVAVPTFAHLTVARSFLERGIPVLVEKPLALNVAESRQLVELADANGTLLQVGHIERFNPAVRTAWPLIQSPKYIRAERYSPFAFRSMDIGVVLDVMIHDIDLVLDLVRSPLRRVEAFGLAILGKQEDAVQARLTFDNGCVADLSANRVHPSTHRMLHVMSPDGSVSIDFQAREVTAFRPSDRLRFGPSPLELASRPDADIANLKQEMFGGFITVERPTVPTADALTDELQAFVSCVQTGERPLVGGREALAAMRAAEEILQRVAAHQWDGRLSGLIGPHANRTDARRDAA